MKKLLRVAAVATSFAGFAIPGIVSAQTATVSTNGWKSPAHVKVTNDVHNTTKAKNNVSYQGVNSQSSYTGDAKVMKNGEVGDVSTGNASTDNKSKVTANVTNSVVGGGSESASSDPSADVSTDGSKSPAFVTVKNDVTNKVTLTNNVNVTTTNEQSSASGNATVLHNGSVGDVTTGNASASNNTEVSLTVSN
jgi:hypothetical protein